jgi:hypothetical protein
MILANTLDQSMKKVIYGGGPMSKLNENLES